MGMFAAPDHPMTEGLKALFTAVPRRLEKGLKNHLEQLQLARTSAD